MFLQLKRKGYNRYGEQFASGLFFVLCQPESEWINGKYHSNCGSEFTRAFVRFASLRQCGHWMMGIVRVNGQSITVSGSYGSDGLPKTVSMDIWEKSIPLPLELYEKWNTGGGWNSCGSEASDMRKWAIEHLDELKRAGV